MARPKRVHPMLRVVKQYIAEKRPDLQSAHIQLRQVDGPPDAARYAATIEGCTAEECPFGVTPETRDAGECDHVCALRDTCRLLLDRQGKVVRVTKSTSHYGS